MKEVQQIVSEKQIEFASHPFFAALDAGAQIEHLAHFAPKLTFWVLGFQDVLRLNERLVKDEALRRIVVKHRREDAGHDVWFLHDIAHLGTRAPGAQELFGAEHEQIRDATYFLMAETIGAADERLRVVLLLTLEAVGHVFFERVAAYVHAQGHSDALKYFSMHHYDVERDHELFTDTTDDELSQIVLPRRVRNEAAAMIGRTFSAFDAMFNNLLRAQQATRAFAVPRQGRGGPR